MATRFETELEREMSRYVQITKAWTGHHRFRILCSWMGAARMKEMCDFLTQQSTESQTRWQDELHADIGADDAQAEDVPRDD